MLDLGAHRGFPTIGLLIRIAERPVLVGALVGEVLGLGRKLLESLALLLAPVGAIAIQPRLLTMQQVGQLLAVVHVGRGHTSAVHKPLRLSAPMCTFMPKYHWLRFLLWCISGSRLCS